MSGKRSRSENEKCDGRIASRLSRQAKEVLAELRAITGNFQALDRVAAKNAASPMLRTS